jgi:hypothetical protein
MEKRYCCFQKGWPRLYAVTKVEFGRAGMGGMEEESASLGPGRTHPADFDFCDIRQTSLHYHQQRKLHWT